MWHIPAHGSVFLCNIWRQIADKLCAAKRDKERIIPAVCSNIKWKILTIPELEKKLVDFKIAFLQAAALTAEQLCITF